MDPQEELQEWLSKAIQKAVDEKVVEAISKDAAEYELMFGGNRMMEGCGMGGGCGGYRPSTYKPPKRKPAAKKAAPKKAAPKKASPSDIDTSVHDAMIAAVEKHLQKLKDAREAYVHAHKQAKADAKPAPKKKAAGNKPVSPKEVVKDVIKKKKAPVKRKVASSDYVYRGYGGGCGYGGGGCGG